MHVTVACGLKRTPYIYPNDELVCFEMVVSAPSAKISKI